MKQLEAFGYFGEAWRWGKKFLRQKPAGRNFGHLAYQVDNIYELCQSLQESGVVINRPPKEGRMAFIRSPDGVSIELLQKGEALEIKEPWASMGNTGVW